MRRRDHVAGANRRTYRQDQAAGRDPTWVPDMPPRWSQTAWDRHRGDRPVGIVGWGAFARTPIGGGARRSPSGRCRINHYPSRTLRPIDTVPWLGGRRQAGPRRWSDRARHLDANIDSESMSPESSADDPLEARACLLAPPITMERPHWRFHRLGLSRAAMACAERATAPWTAIGIDKAGVVWLRSLAPAVR